MTKETASLASTNHSFGRKKYSCPQIRSIEDLLRGETIKMPPPYSAFKKAQRVQKKEGSQGEFEF